MNARLITCSCLLLTFLSITAHSKTNKARKNKPAPPTVMQLLDKYTLALDSVSNAIEDYENTVKASSNGATGFSESNYSTRGQYRYDGQQIYSREYKWGNTDSRIPEFTKVTEDKPRYSCVLTNNEITYQNSKNKQSNQDGFVKRHEKRKDFKETNIARFFGPSYLAGYFGSDLRLDKILRKSNEISVHDKAVMIGGSKCYALEAKTKHGQYNIWLDSEHGFHPARVLHKSSEGDYTFKNLLTKGGSYKSFLKDVRFEKIDGVWVPMEANAGNDFIVKQGFSKENYHYKRTKFVVNPDHDKLGSFDDPIENPQNDPELMNGTLIQIDNIPIKYTWQDGAVVDADGNKIDMKKILSEPKARK